MKIERKYNTWIKHNERGLIYLGVVYAKNKTQAKRKAAELDSCKNIRSAGTNDSGITVSAA